MFKKWFSISEMAHLSVPPELRFQLPSSNHGPGNPVQVGALDMRFEDYMPHMGSGNAFIAKIPSSNRFLVYHGWAKKPTQILSQQDLEKHTDDTYAILPHNWWRFAMVFSFPNFDLVKPALADELGIRA